MTTHRPDPTVIHFTIDGRHGILGARHIAEALHIPYEPASTPEYHRMSSHSRHNRLRYLRDHTTCPYVPSTVPTPEATSSTPPTTPKTPPVVPATSAPPPSESTITISLQSSEAYVDTATFGYLSPPEHDMPGPSEPTIHLRRLLQQSRLPHEETATIEIETPSRALRLPWQSHRLHTILPPLPDHLSTFFKLKKTEGSELACKSKRSNEGCGSHADEGNFGAEGEGTQEAQMLRGHCGFFEEESDSLSVFGRHHWHARIIFGGDSKIVLLGCGQ
ncbi:hypothetical protein CK203_038037 [Vitis vinifera]|uniref:Uncharacterized protein n=1 Tax=Vitis vinifera TaxID=29760 RepID=A0A438HNR4_VITVI|nr:hypothetical protein CK203_038037 [Vitis vinifera]